jgi:isopropylmalate/homocitrate/citramalate synthase
MLTEEQEMDEKKWLNDDYWLSEFNWLPDVRKNLTLPKEKIWVHECTLREAEQTPGLVLKPDEKIALAKVLDDLGVSSLEIFPVTSPDDKEVTKELVKMNLRAQIRPLARWLITDIDAVLECGVKAIEVENTANPWTNQVAYGLSEDQIVSNFIKATRYAKENGLHVTVMPWDTYRCPLPFLERLYKAIVYEGGADRVVVVDSSGIGLPWTTMYLIPTVQQWIPGVPIEMHAHNEMGLANATMLSAVAGGAVGVHTVLCGYGTRGGNAATEEVATNLKVLMGVDTGIDLSKLYYACKLIQDLSKIPMPPNKPIIGDNLYTYATGLSIDIFHKASAAGRSHALVPLKPSLIGRCGYNIALGKMAGKSAVRSKLNELGIEVTPDQLLLITDRVKQEGSLRKGSLSDDVFLGIVKQVIG